MNFDESRWFEQACAISGKNVLGIKLEILKGLEGRADRQAFEKANVVYHAIIEDERTVHDLYKEGYINDDTDIYSIWWNGDEDNPSFLIDSFKYKIFRGNIDAGTMSGLYEFAFTNKYACEWFLEHFEFLFRQIYGFA